MDYRCPQCQESLRFRSLTEHEVPHPSRSAPRRWYQVCPACQTKLIQRRHPAFANHWLWMRFVLPGILLTGAGIFWWPPLLWVSVPAMGLGLLVAMVYTVRERLNFKVFALLDEQADTHPPQRTS